MKYLVWFLFYLVISGGVFAQTTPIATTIIPYAQPDFVYNPGKGAEEWIGNNVINVPVEGTNTPRNDWFWRFSWSDFQSFNSSITQYQFTNLDNQINSCIDNNQVFSFGIMINFGNSTSFGGGQMTYPLAMHNGMQAETTKDILVGGSWYENTNSITLRTWFKALHTAISNHIATTSHNGVPYSKVVRRIDARIVGDFSEGIVLPSQSTLNTVNGVPTAASLDSLLDIYRQAYSNLPNTYIVNMIGIFSNGFPGSCGVGVSPGSTGYFALNIRKNGVLFGWRRDNWSRTDGYIRCLLDQNTAVVNGMRFDTAIMNRYKYAPVCGEPEYDDNNFGADLSDLVAEVQRYHAESVGNGNFLLALSAAAKNNFRAASLLMGYRYNITGGSMTTSLIANNNFNITLNWQNVGLAPAYDRWLPMYELRNGAGTVLWTGTSALNLTNLQPAGTPTVVNESFLLGNVPAGTYSMYLIVRDSLGYRNPMPVAITGRGADGAYLLRSGIVVSNGPPSPPVAIVSPTNQTITLPTNTATLNGTPSTGTITSQTWTLVSGPSTPTFGTPNALTTTVNNLTSGTYIFQLSLNAGVSTARDTVIVVPSPIGIVIFPTQTPVQGTGNDGQPLEVGVKFRSSQNGFILGIRFYKTTGNTGTHIGELYTSTGTRLGQATFTGETATGWQTVFFTTPVPIVANTTYVAAYWSGNGNYVGTSGYFTVATTNPPLTALANGTDGVNGVFKYSATPTLPTNGFNQSNYWVDVMYQPGNNPPPCNCHPRFGGTKIIIVNGP